MLVNTDINLELTNIALLKPAQQSSYSAWSKPNESIDAVNGTKTGDYSFHTDLQLNPWWQVDLEEIYPIFSIIIFNRGRADSVAAARAKRLSIYFSLDSYNWGKLYFSDQAFGGILDKNPLVISCLKKYTRYIRIQLYGNQYLHLDEVEIYTNKTILQNSLEVNYNNEFLSLTKEDRLLKNNNLLDRDEAQVGNIDQVHLYKSENFLMIKSWGYGFMSDVSHVIGQLLVAELSGRIPVIHWGGNSLFSEDEDLNTFELYFEAVSNFSFINLINRNFSYWPPKWNCNNIEYNDNNKRNGIYSRISGKSLLTRTEKVVVSDFYSSISSLRPVIPTTHYLFGMSVDDLYLYIIKKYLRPKKHILDTVDIFCKKYFPNFDFLAVHIRGSDKIADMSDLHSVNLQYKKVIDEYLEIHNCKYIFLMTDDSLLLDTLTKIYGRKIISTECHRTTDDRGVHRQSLSNKYQLGFELMVDVYIASQAKAFIGNAQSNPSVIIKYLKHWPKKNIFLFGDLRFH